MPNISVTAAARLLPAVGIATLVIASTGCSHTTAGNGATAHPPSVSATAVNPALLDPGHYPTKPQAPIGNAGSDQVGRLAEGRRMASYSIGPWQVDPALAARAATDTQILDSFEKLGTSLTWPPIAAGGAHGLPFLVGFMSQRHTATGPSKSLRNAVLRFADPGSANTATQGFFAQAMGMPRTVDVTPIVIEPETSLPIPGHPDAKAALLTFQDQETGHPVKELTVATSHGPFVLFQVVRCDAGPDCMTQLAGHTLDLQLPLIDTFTPTPATEFATLPLDPTGLFARTLPLPDDEITTTSGAYPPAGALHFEDDPIKASTALAAAAVDEVSIARTTLYQAKTADAAVKLADDYGAIVASDPGARPAEAVPGLPQSRCTLIPGAGGLIPHHWCVAAVDRYMVKAVARQLDTAHKLIAAQYRILNP